jgi:hypothetical protein
LKVKWRQGSREAEPKITAANTDKREAALLGEHDVDHLARVPSHCAGHGRRLGLALFSRLRSQARAGQLGLRLGPPEAVSFEGLVERARQLTARPYVPPPMPAPEVGGLAFGPMGHRERHSGQALYLHHRSRGDCPGDPGLRARMVRWLGDTAYSAHAGPGDTAGRDNSGASSCDTRSGHPGAGSARAVGTGVPPICPAERKGGRSRPIASRGRGRLLNHAMPAMVAPLRSESKNEPMAERRITALERDEAAVVCAKIKARHPDILDRLPDGL